MPIHKIKDSNIICSFCNKPVRARYGMSFPVFIEPLIFCDRWLCKLKRYMKENIRVKTTFTRRIKCHNKRLTSK